MLNPTTKTYSPSEVSVIVGNDIIDVFNTVEIALAEDKITHSTASTGQSTRIINPSMLGTITLNLPQSAETNDKVLEYYEKIIEEYMFGEFVSIEVKDKLGTSKYKIEKASIKKPSDSNFEKEDSDRSWVFEGDFTKYKPGGAYHQARP